MKYLVICIQTLAVVGATPSPDLRLVANADAIQDVMVSGTVVLMTAWPSSLQRNTGEILDTCYFKYLDKISHIETSRLLDE